MVVMSIKESSQIIAKAVSDVNAQKQDGTRIEFEESTCLIGGDGVIDSLGFAFLIVTIEQYALDDLGKEIMIVDDEVMEMDFDSVANPFTTIGSLIAFVGKKLTVL